MAIDALRGIALFGVLMVNLITEFRVSIFAQFLPAAPEPTPWYRWVDTFVSGALAMKAFSLFSLLFGLGLAMQFERLQRRPDRLRLLLRRLTSLLGFGLVHLFLIWNGDILTEYAIVGFVMLPLLYGPRWALGVVAAVALSVYAAMPFLHLPIPFPTQGWIASHIAQADAVFRRGGYLEVVRFNVSEVPALLPLHLFVAPRTLGLFALGAWLWRSGIFQRPSGGSWMVLAAVALALDLALSIGLREGPFGSAVDQIAPVLLALVYCGVVMAIAARESTRPIVAWAAPLGRTAFSNYILQSVIFGWIFFGYGLGLFDRLRPAQALLLGLTVYAAQALLSALWLRRFRFGPLEWLWRCLMYGQRQRFLREGAPAAA